MEKVCVIGLGYIGLPTASILATKGFQVHGVDVSQKVVDTINKGEIHIVEPDLDILVKAAVGSGKLKASLEPEEADIFIIAVPTPFKDGKKPDISYVESACNAISPFLQEGNVVILESTSPVGTTERVRDILAEKRPEFFNGRMTATTSAKISIAHCPERVLPGQILKELIGNDRIIGGIDQLSREKAKIFYKKFVSGAVVVTDAKTAELAKLTENASRDVNIAFANELALICDKLGINVWELIELANLHPRINILQPGPGVGGHCIAVDPWFIIDSAPEVARLIRTAREVNDSKPDWVFEKVRANAERFKNPVIGCLGLSYKANIDDVRESPAMAITKKIIQEGLGEILVCEPNCDDGGFEISLCGLDEVVKRSDILVALVKHDEFLSVDPELLKEKVVIDTAGVWR